MRNITYENVSENPTTSARTVRFVLTDGDGGTSNTETETINVTAQNDAPVLDTSGTATLTAINENETQNNGDLVAAMIASAGGDPITDDDTAAVEGIAVTAVDESNGVWEFSTNGGSSWTPFGAVSDTSAVLLGDGAGDRIRFVPATNFNGSASINYQAWDRTDSNASGTTGVDVSSAGGATAYSTATETAAVTVNPVQIVLHVSTSGDVSMSGAPGLDSWDNGETIAFGDPNLDFEPGITDGTFYRFFDLRTFVTNGANAEVDALHHVSNNTTVGGNGGPSMDLFAGDVLFSVTNNNVELTGSDTASVTTDKKSLYRMALPVWWSGVTSRGGLDLCLELVPWFLHQRQDLRSAFVDSGFDSPVAVADTLTPRGLLSQSCHFLTHADHRAQQPVCCQKLHRCCEAQRAWIAT